MNLLQSKCVLFFIASSLGQYCYATEPWNHPGVLVSEVQLDFVKQQVTNHVEPYYSQFLKAQASNYGSKTYKVRGPAANGVTQCGSYSSPDKGCSDANYDTNAAYIQALLWYITEDVSYANNAKTIMNTYAQKLEGFAGFSNGYPCPGATDTCSNGPLQAAWDATKWPRAAEIIRYGHGGSANWSPTDIAAFSNMLTNVYQPVIYKGSSFNGNWELSMIEGMMGIAVFNEDLALLNHAQTFWSERVPAYFYNYDLDNSLYPNTHAPFPVGRATSSDWNGQLIFSPSTTGVTQETCRDLKHTEYGIASAINAAETDYIQTAFTANLYTANGAEERLINALNFAAGLETKASKDAPTDFCTDANDKITLGLGTTYVIGYNHYHNRLNNPNMTDASGTSGLLGTANTYNRIQNGVLPQKQTTDSGAHMTIFESLTHYGNGGSVGSANFSLSLAPPSQTVSAGATTSYKVIVTPRNNYNNNVQLIMPSGLPKDSTASFNPITIPGGTGSSVLTITTSENTALGSNTFTIAATDGTLQNTITGTLIINSTPTNATIQANNASMVNGGALPTLMYTVNPALTLSTKPTCTTTASSKSPVGIYPINCTGAVKDGYTFAYISGTLTITAKVQTATVSARKQHIKQGKPIPILTYRVRPKDIVFTQQPVCTTSATSKSPVGSYPIECSSAQATGYNIIYENSVLTIK